VKAFILPHSPDILCGLVMAQDLYELETFYIGKSHNMNAYGLPHSTALCELGLTHVLYEHQTLFAVELCSLMAYILLHTNTISGNAARMEIVYRNGYVHVSSICTSPEMLFDFVITRI
jgi:hypothetical protein